MGIKGALTFWNKSKGTSDFDGNKMCVILLPTARALTAYAQYLADVEPPAEKRGNVNSFKKLFQSFLPIVIKIFNL